MAAVRYRALREAERQQRGCQYCADVYKGWGCPFEVRPYHTLDSFTRYQDYLKAEGATVPQIIRKLKDRRP